MSCASRFVACCGLLAAAVAQSDFRGPQTLAQLRSSLGGLGYSNIKDSILLPYAGEADITARAPASCEYTVSRCSPQMTLLRV